MVLYAPWFLMKIKISAPENNLSTTEPSQVSDLKWDIPVSIGTGVRSGKFYKFVTRILFLLLLSLKFFKFYQEPQQYL